MSFYPSTPVLIDWLSISGKSRGIAVNKLKVVKLEYGTSVFKCIEELYYNSDRVATVASNPYSSVIDPDLFQVKFDNWLLYHTEFINLFGLIIKEVRLYDYKISRIDLCKDLNRFYRGLKPSKLIAGFMSAKYIKIGKSKYSVWGEVDRTLTYDYLSFGRKSSPVNSYLYNKSQEMKQVKYKPHIVNKWKEYGLTSGEDVYRLEISIKKPVISLVNKDTGENFVFDINRIFIQEELEQLFVYMCRKYFRFKINSGNKNITREKPVILFKVEEYDSMVWEPVAPVETNRADKIFIKKLDALYSELRLNDVQLFNKIHDIRDIFAKKKNLTEFMQHKVKPQVLRDIEHPAYHEPGLKAEYLEKNLF